MTAPTPLVVAIHDRGFVAAPLRAIYDVVAAPARYGGWWPRTTLRGAADGTVHLVLAGFGRVAVAAARERPPDSFTAALSNDRTEGTLEWFLEPFDPGAIVHVLLGLTRADGWNRRREQAYRGAVREGLVALKRALEPRPAA